MPQCAPCHECQEDWRRITEGADGACDADEDGRTNRPRQSPPDRRADDDCATQQEQSDSISSQRRIKVLHCGSDPSYASADGVGEVAQDRGDTEEKLIEKRRALLTS
jgi:hypothetical protein